MVGAVASPAATRAGAPVVRTLLPEDVPALRLLRGRGSQPVCDLLERHPGRSVWVPETLEYALIGAWRNRPEIACVEDLVAVRHAEPLLRGAFERCVAWGDDLLLAVDLETHRGPSLFERAGFQLLEEVMTYEVAVSSVPSPDPRTFRRVIVHPGDALGIDRLLKIDRVAFPWLWRNSRVEFEIYLGTPGVEVSLLEVAGNPIAYTGTTLYAGWGHLDRIAVVPAAQGRGYGREALALAIDTLRQKGARRVALSTQRTNERSQRLYERFGFRRTPELDYRLFGAWCRPEHEVTGQPARQ